MATIPAISKTPRGGSRLRRLPELAVESLIRLCGWSAILFVFAIFFFVFREGAPFLFGELNPVSLMLAMDISWGLGHMLQFCCGTEVQDGNRARARTDLAGLLAANLCHADILANQFLLDRIATPLALSTRSILIVPVGTSCS